MADLKDFSRLPADPDYWSDLESRIAAAVSSDDTTPEPWWQPLARGAWGFGGLAAAAAIATILLAPARQSETGLPARLLGTEISDPTLARFVESPAAPHLTSLLVPPPEGPR